MHGDREQSRVSGPASLQPLPLPLPLPLRLPLLSPLASFSTKTAHCRLHRADTHCIYGRYLTSPRSSHALTSSLPMKLSCRNTQYSNPPTNMQKMDKYIFLHIATSKYFVSVFQQPWKINLKTNLPALLSASLLPLRYAGEVRK